MAKLPKIPKKFSIPATTATKPVILPTKRINRMQPKAEWPVQQHAPIPKPPAQAHEPTLKQRLQDILDERPRVSDLRRLSDEELKSAQHQAKLRRWRQWPMFAMGLVAFGMGMYGVMLWTSLTRDSDLKDLPEDLSDRFDREAEGYDEKVDTSEMLLFLRSKRKSLTAKAKGHVLEVAVGTGRNIPHYKPKQCATVTLLDSSGPMLSVAKRKWNDTHKEYFSRVFFKQQSALDPIIPPFGAQDGYDTVIQTMGLCSTPEPVKLLQNIEASTNEDGQILLLEHGKSHYEWLNNALDKTAPAHANEHGCWWNKDIGRIVEESGLEVLLIKRYNFGTTWWIELKPRKGMRKQLGESLSQERVHVAPPASQASPKPWWLFWK